MRLSNAQVEKICLALNCTPSDLFSWHPVEGQSVAAGHSMQALVRVKTPGITELLQAIPVDRIEELRTLMMQMSGGA